MSENSNSYKVTDTIATQMSDEKTSTATGIVGGGEIETLTMASSLLMEDLPFDVPLSSESILAKETLQKQLEADIETSQVKNIFPNSVQVAFQAYFENVILPSAIMPEIVDLQQQSETPQESKNFDTCEDPFKGAIRDQKVWHQSLQKVLISIAGQPRNIVPFFTIVNSYFIQKKYRHAALILLSSFITNQKGHNCHFIVSTPLYKNILQCLLYDTSTSVISLALTTLVMLIPFTCNVIVKELLDLLSIYVRLICWDLYKGTLQVIEATDDSNGKKRDISFPVWDKLESAFDTATSSTPPDCAQYFSYLYGLFPNNMVKFLRDPHKYLQKSSSVSLSDEVDEHVVRDRSMRYIQRHKLNSLLFLDTAEGELTNIQRWMRTEAAEVVATCLALDTLSSGSMPTFLDVKDSDDVVAIETKDRNDKKDLSEQGMVSLHDIVTMHEVLKGNSLVVGNDMWTSYAITNLNSSSLIKTSETSNDKLKELEPQLNLQARQLISDLTRENLLLKNELNYELYLKQQYLYHIGRLQRKRVEDYGVEAERQMLYNMTKSQTQKLIEKENKLDQWKAESTKRATTSRHFDIQQKEKNEKQREEIKRYREQIENLGRDILDAKVLNESLTVELEDSRSKLFEMSKELSTCQQEAELARLYKQRVQQLSQELLLWERDMVKFKEQKGILDRVLAKKSELETFVKMQEEKLSEAQKSIRNYERELDILWKKVRNNKEERNIIVENAKNSIETENQGEIEYRVLREKYVNLQKEMLEVKSKAEYEGIKRDKESRQKELSAN